MRLTVVQYRPIVGVVEGNVDRHLAFVDLADQNQASLVIFPELSLTGYEPSRAQELSRELSDPCFRPLQLIANSRSMTVCVGVPLRTLGSPQIATLIFRPGREATVYTKEYLHSDELPYFSAGSNPSILINLEPPIALAICYELSIAEHANRAAQSGSVAYIASVAKTAEGMVRAQARMAAIAKQYAMPTAMANCLGKQDGVECSGQSAAWDRQGRLLAQLDSQREGLVVLDVATCESTQTYLE